MILFVSSGCICIPSAYNSVPHHYNCIPQAYISVPHCYNCVPQAYISVPHRYNCTPSAYISVPSHYNRIPSTCISVPQRYNCIPSAYNSVPQRYSCIHFQNPCIFFIFCPTDQFFPQVILLFQNCFPSDQDPILLSPCGNDGGMKSCRLRGKSLSAR